MNNKRQTGFTLLEILISVALFSLVSAATFAMLQLTIKSSEGFTTKASYLVELQRAQRLLQQDFSQTVARTVRDEFGDVLPAVMTDDSGWSTAIELTRTGRPNPLLKPRSDLIRLRYVFDGEHVIRRTWPQLDRAPGVEYQGQIIVNNVKSWHVSVLDGTKWLESWPPELDDEDAKITALPAAFEVKLELENGREFQWLFAVYPQVLTH